MIYNGLINPVLSAGVRPARRVVRGEDEEDVQLSEEGHAGARQTARQDRLQAQDAEERQRHRQPISQVSCEQVNSPCFSPPAPSFSARPRRPTSDAPDHRANANAHKSEAERRNSSLSFPRQFKSTWCNIKRPSGQPDRREESKGG